MDRGFQVWKFHLKISPCEEKPCLPRTFGPWEASFFFLWANFWRWRNFHTWNSAHSEILYWSLITSTEMFLLRCRIFLGRQIKRGKNLMWNGASKTEMKKEITVLMQHLRGFCYIVNGSIWMHWYDRRVHALWPLKIFEQTYTVLHMFRQVLFGSGNQSNHQNFEKSLISCKCGLIFPICLWRLKRVQKTKQRLSHVSSKKG